MIDFHNIRYIQDSSETYINTDNNFSEYIENLRKEKPSISIKIKPEIFPEISKVIEHVQKIYYQIFPLKHSSEMIRKFKQCVFQE